MQKTPWRVRESDLYQADEFGSNERDDVSALMEMRSAHVPYGRGPDRAPLPSHSHEKTALPGISRPSGWLLVGETS